MGAARSVLDLDECVPMRRSRPAWNRTKYTYDTNRPQILTAVGTDVYSFDPYGNLMQQTAGNQFTFNAFDYLATFQNASGAYSYYYDENGDRLFKSGVSGTTLYMGKYYERGPLGFFKYIYAGDRRIASLSNGATGTTYYHLDHLGSVNYLTDANGNLVLHREHAPFGEVAVTTGSAVVNVGFANQYFDSESGLNYFGKRYFVPGVGRWASADPMFSNALKNIEDRQQIGLWNYTNNNPLRFTDYKGSFIFIAALIYDYLSITPTQDTVTPESHPGEWVVVGGTAAASAASAVGSSAAKAVVSSVSDAISSGAEAAAVGGALHGPDGPPVLGQNPDFLGTKNSGSYVRDAGGPVNVYNTTGEGDAYDFFNKTTGQNASAPATQTYEDPVTGQRFTVRPSSSTGPATIDNFDPQNGMLEKMRFNSTPESGVNSSQMDVPTSNPTDTSPDDAAGGDGL